MLKYQHVLSIVISSSVAIIVRSVLNKMLVGKLMYVELLYEATSEGNYISYI